jgi:hypothetical protein
MDLFAKDPVLKNFIRRGDEPSTIRTDADLGRVAATLEQAVEILLKAIPAADRKNSADAVKVLSVLDRDEAYAPRITITDRETYGLPKGTRLLTFFATPFEHLTVAKIDGHYKIIAAQMQSAD